jgi:tetratricopeptide (TPR) repeat protein
MKRWIAIALMASAVAGCQPTQKEAKKEALDRWQGARAQMTYAVASEEFNSGQLDQACAKTMEALSLEPNYMDAHALLGRIYIEQGHSAAAVAELKWVCQQRPRSSEATYLLGVAQEKDGKLDDALASYQLSFVLDAKNLSAAIAAAEVMVAMGRVVDAQTYVDSYMSQASSEPGMFELAGRLALMQDQYPEAAKCYQQALDLDPKNIRYREALGMAEFNSQRYAQAIEALLPLTKMPDRTPAAWVHRMLGDSYMALNRPAEARNCFQAGKELQPSEPSAWANLAKAYLATGDDTRAIMSAQQALKLQPGQDEATIVLGYAILRDGQNARAVEVLTRACQASPSSAMLQCLLGRAHAASGDAEKATRCYAAALKVEPDNALARELLTTNGAAKPAAPAEQDGGANQ